MTSLLGLFTGALIFGSLALLVWMFVPQDPNAPARPAGATRLRRRLGMDRRATAAQRRRRVLLAGSIVLGVMTWAITGWLLAVVIVPLALFGLPVLLQQPTAAAEIDRLEGVEEWARNLAGILLIGTPIKDALIASHGTTPAVIQPEVALLAARLQAGMDATEALWIFGEDLGDATAQTISAALRLGLEVAPAGLAAAIEDFAGTLAEEVAARRSIESERARPRKSARLVTLVSAFALIYEMLLNPTFARGYATATGQLLLAVFLTMYALLLLWMKRLSRFPPPPRILRHADTYGGQ